MSGDGGGRGKSWDGSHGQVCPLVSAGSLHVSKTTLGP